MHNVEASPLHVASLSVLAVIRPSFCTTVSKPFLNLLMLSLYGRLAVVPTPISVPFRPRDTHAGISAGRTRYWLGNLGSHWYLCARKRKEGKESRSLAYYLESRQPCDLVSIALSWHMEITREQDMPFSFFTLLSVPFWHRSLPANMHQ